MTINDELSKLPPATFRGIRFPVTARTHSVSMNRSKTVIIYRDGEYVQVFGLTGRQLNYQVPMRSGIESSGYSRLFAQVDALYDAFRNPEPGPLFDPKWGELLVSPGSWSDEMTAMLRDGVDVTLSFDEHTPIGEEVDSRPVTLQTIEQDNTTLDAVVAATAWTIQTQPDTEKTDPLSAAAGVMNQVSYAKDNFNAQILSVGNKAAKVERAAEKLGVAGEPARRAARKLRIDCERTAAAPPREKFGVVVQIAEDTPKTISQMALDSGMTVEQLLRSDMKLARRVLTPPGQRVWSKPRPRVA